MWINWQLKTCGFDVSFKVQFDSVFLPKRQAIKMINNAGSNLHFEVVEAETPRFELFFVSTWCPYICTKSL